MSALTVRQRLTLIDEMALIAGAHPSTPEEFDAAAARLVAAGYAPDAEAAAARARREYAEETAREAAKRRG
jgi:hypothetical protein